MTLKIENKYTEGYQITREPALTEQKTADNDILDINTYQWNLLKNGTLLHRFTGYEPDGSDAREEIARYISETEPDSPAKSYLLKSIIPENCDIPPWERTKITRPQLTLQNLSLSFSDEGNAVRFEQECSGWLIFDSYRNKWYAWETNHWEPAKNKLGRALRFVGKSIEQELTYWAHKSAADPGNRDLTAIVKSLELHAKISRNHSSQKSLCKMLETSSMCINFKKASSKDYIAFRNGAVNCITGEILPLWKCSEIKEKYPTTYIDAEYTSGKRSHAFSLHEWEIFTDNTTPGLTDDEREKRAFELCRCFERYLGYILYPWNREQIFIFFWGNGCNGKSTTIDALRNVLGDEIAEASISEMYYSSEDRPRSGINHALECRCVVFSEAGDEENARFGGRVSIKQAKILTGERTTSAFRGHQKGAEEQDIICTPIGVTNELPHFDGELNYALLRRIITIPFFHRFTDAEMKKNIRDELIAERDGIFSMMIDELCAYVREGLLELPAFCRREQQELMAGASYSAFVAENLAAGEEGDKISRKEIERMYLAWCGEKDMDVAVITIDRPGIGDWGVNKEQALRESEKRKLFGAMRIFGYQERKTCGTWYFLCKRK